MSTRTLYERIGGGEVVAAVVDDLYERLTHDPRVLHHFDPSRLESLKAGQRRWFTSVLGGSDEADRPDLAAAHRNVPITDEQVTVVVGHLDRALADAGVDQLQRRQVMALVSRLWHARVF